MASTKALWSNPHPETSQLHAFRVFVNLRTGRKLRTYNDLHQWSCTHIDEFAWVVWSFCGIKYSVAPTSAGVGLDKMWPPPKWFPGARLNYTENILGPGLSSRPDAIAVTVCQEGMIEYATHLTFRELEAHVAKWTHALRKVGVQKGDRVATVLTSSVDCVSILLAAGAIGAIFSSTSPDMGTSGIVDRYSQLHPTVLFVETRIRYGGKVHDLKSRLSEVNRQLEKLVPGLRSTVVVSGPMFCGRNVVSKADIWDDNAVSLTYEQLPFDYPIYILYSSGTTGAPKCIIHAAGRALLQQKKELLLKLDLGPYSTWYQYTTTGWMMWNYMIAGLSCGARIVLYDGSPLHPSPLGQLKLLEQQNVTHWGTSPKFLAALRHKGVPQTLQLTSLLYVSSAGSPLNPDLSYWFYDNFPKNVGLFSGSGGTDLVGSIVGGSPLHDNYAGEIAAPGLGMKVEIWDEHGANIEDSGESGELIISKPFFSMPIGFWGFEGDEKYRKAYFADFPGVWTQGDLIRKNPSTGGYEILGRSDGVLNPGGVRFGTAELYRLLDSFNDIEDCIAVGQRLQSTANEQVLLFLKLKKGTLSGSLRAAIQSRIRTNLSARHVPSGIYQVKDIPYTINGKRIEKTVRDIVSGKKSAVSATVANPECLEEYQQYAVPLVQTRSAKL